MQLEDLALNLKILATGTKCLHGTWVNSWRESLLCAWGAAAGLGGSRKLASSLLSSSSPRWFLLCSLRRCSSSEGLGEMWVLPS